MTAETPGGPRVGRVAALVLVVGLLAIALVVDRTTGDDASRVTTAARDATTPRPDASVATWYCAEGTSAPNGRADELVYVANVGTAAASARVSVMAGDAARTVPLDVPANTMVPVRVADVLPHAEPGVLVEASGGEVVVSHSLTGNNDVAIGPCASSPSPDWHFAAGNTSRGSQMWLALFNPTADDAIVDLSFATDTGPIAPEPYQGVVVPRASRVSIPVHEAAPRRLVVGTSVHARRGQVVAEQSLVLDGTDGRRGLAVSLGAPALARRWELPTGLLAPGRGQQVVVANPGEESADVTLHVRLDAAAEIAPQEVTVGPGSAVNVDLGPVPTGVGFSSMVESSRPVAVETIASTVAPNAPPVRGLASALGQPAAANRWVLAPARSSARANDFVAVVNPGRRAASLTASTVGEGSRRALDDLPEVPAGARVVLDLGRLGVPVGTALVLRADRPVVVDREASAVPGLTLAAAVPDVRRR
jgi:hypothetical protein